MGKLVKSLICVVFLLVFTGCAGLKPVSDPGAQPPSGTEEEKIDNLKITEFMLSPGDEISISVYQHDKLTRKVKIPPNGKFFFPIVGEINISGKTLNELRTIITDGLSNYREMVLLPGDEISITVFRHEEFNRKFVVPSDGFFFFPLVGDIKAEGKSTRELGKLITAGLVPYVVDPQVMIDIVQLSNPERIVNPQVSIEVNSFSGQRIFVLGEVLRPGVFLADGHTGIVEAIALAGGPTMDAKQESIAVIRGATKQTHIVNLESLMAGDTTQNLILQKGDIVYLSRTFISNVDRFFGHFAKIISPIVDVEKGYWLGQSIEAGARASAVAP